MGVPLPSRPALDHVDADVGIKQVAEYQSSEGLTVGLPLVRSFRQKVVSHGRSMEEETVPTAAHRRDDVAEEQLGDEDHEPSLGYI